MASIGSLCSAVGSCWDIGAVQQRPVDCLRGHLTTEKALLFGLFGGGVGVPNYGGPPGGQGNTVINGNPNAGKAQWCEVVAPATHGEDSSNRRSSALGGPNVGAKSV